MEIKKLNKSYIDKILEIENSQNVSILSRNIIENNIEISTINYYGILDDDNLIGYMCFSSILETCDLESIVVHKDYTRKNIATLLLKFLISFCRTNSIYNIFLEVDESNLPAISLYEKFNFTKIDERKNYYKNGNTAYIYNKKL